MVHDNSVEDVVDKNVETDINEDYVYSSNSDQRKI